MKTYQKKEIKNILEKNFDKLTVSEELKKQTFAKITTYKTPSFAWLNKCAAVFIVSLLCLCIYLHKTPNLLHNPETSLQITGSTPQDINTDVARQQHNTSSTTSLTHDAIYGIPEANIQNSEIFSLNKSMHDSKQILLEDCEESLKALGSISNNQAVINEPVLGDTEEKLLMIYPMLKKVENGYLLELDSAKILYKISNGIISEIITQ